jgi:hypothetical protein
MAAVAAIHRPRQVAIQMQETRPRQMPGGVGPRTGFGIVQLMAAIENAPARIIEMIAKRAH